MSLVSPRLRAKLIEIYLQHRQPEDWPRRNGIMASFIIADYCGKFPDQLNGSFIRKIVDHNGHVNPAYIERITHLADCLFNLSDEPTFGVMIRRLLDRDTRPVFFELSAAEFFKRKGFSITANEEKSPVRGENFDFAVHSDDVNISIEVSAFGKEHFAEGSLKNKLKKKAGQVPKDQPAILFLHIPASWYDLNHLYFFLMKVAFDFFKNSRTYNAILFQTEIMGYAGEGFYWLLHIDPFAHPNPRNEMDSKFIFEPGITLPPNDEKMIKQSPGTRTKYFEDLLANGNIPECRQSFIRWIKQQIGEM